MRPRSSLSIFFFFNDTATTEIYTLSLHDALPISFGRWEITPLKRNIQPEDKGLQLTVMLSPGEGRQWQKEFARDRKSTRLNSSHLVISYAVFCLKKKK